LGRRGRDRRGGRRRSRPAGRLRIAGPGAAGPPAGHGIRPQSLEAPRLPDRAAPRQGGGRAGGRPRAARPGRRAGSAAAGGGGGPIPRGVGRRGAVVSAKPEETVLELDGREVRITSPQKVFFPERGETKLDLVRYYEAVREPLMAAMGGRPVLLQRYPEGAGGSSFFQKRVPKDAPDWPQTSPTSPGPSTSAASASTSGPTWPPIPTTPTSSASTSTPPRASPSTRCA